MTATEKSTEINSSLSSEFDKEDRKNETQGTSKCFLKSFTFADKCFKKDHPYGKTCYCDGPPVIAPKHSMKLLPSIPEISENSSSKRDDRANHSVKSKRISFDKPHLFTSSKEDITDPRKNMSKMRICVPKMTDVDVTVCPRYADKAVSFSRFVGIK